MVKNISVRKLRANLAHVLEDVRAHFDRYVISKHGKPEAVLMCIDDYQGWLETLEIMSDKKAMADIRKAKKELAEGKGYALEEVFGKLPRKRIKSCMITSNNAPHLTVTRRLSASDTSR